MFVVMNAAVNITFPIPNKTSIIIIIWFVNTWTFSIYTYTYIELHYINNDDTNKGVSGGNETYGSV